MAVMTPAQILRSPREILPRVAMVKDIRTSAVIKYDPTAITHQMHLDILDYWSDPPRDAEGRTYFVALLAGRQGGKSTVPEMCAYVRASTSPEWDHVTIADKKERADYLHARVHLMHHYWPEAIRTPTLNAQERRALSFNRTIGGKMRVLSGDSDAVAIGQSPDSYHGSEIPFWDDAATQYSYLWPSLIQRSNALVMNESTAAPPSEPSLAFWQEHYRDARTGKGRLIAAFYPFWDSKLNSRPVPADFAPTQEELVLLNKYGPTGLRVENLQFRRLMMDTDPEFRRSPEYFGVFYPFDDESCWISATTSVFTEHILSKVATQDRTDDHREDYTEFAQPMDGAIYVIGADPCGHAARDHAAFVVLEVWADRITLVASYAAHTEPRVFAGKLIEASDKYNGARVFVELTGVGEATVAVLRERGFERLFWSGAGTAHRRPGIPMTAPLKERLISMTADALLENAEIPSARIYGQLRTYAHDKLTEDSARSEIIRGSVSTRRRERHHWDSVSAFMLGIYGASMAPQRMSPGSSNVTALRASPVYRNIPKVDRTRELGRITLGRTRKKSR